MKLSKLRNYGIKNLMIVIVIANILVYLLSVFGGINLSLQLTLVPQLVLRGEVWRLISYIFVPTTFNPIFFIISLMCYYYIGRQLEFLWGTFKFNVYYFLGIIIMSLASMLTGIYVLDAGALNFSLFLAYAVYCPNQIVYLFYVVPVKMKYVAIVILTVTGYNFLITSTLGGKVLQLVPILNFIIFFAPMLIKNSKMAASSRVRKQKFQGKVLNFSSAASTHNHKCEICGKTEKDDENLEFRYCSRCNGSYEYCSEHIFDHNHK